MELRSEEELHRCYDGWSLAKLVRIGRYLQTVAYSNAKAKSGGFFFAAGVLPEIWRTCLHLQGDVVRVAGGRQES